MINKSELVRYLKFSELGKDESAKITRINNSLYILYYLWIKHLSETVTTENEYSEDVRKSDLTYKLFNHDFKATHYGVYDETIIEYIKSLEPFSKSEAVQFLNDLRVKSEFLSVHVESVTMRIGNTSTFSLLDLSHRSLAWNEAFKNGDKTSLKEDLILQENVIK